MSELTESERASWQEWLSERPPAVRAVAERLPGYRAYRMKSTGHVVQIYSYDEEEDGRVTLKVNVNRDLNPETVFFERTVFGISPDDLEEIN